MPSCHSIMPCSRAPGTLWVWHCCMILGQGLLCWLSHGVAHHVLLKLWPKGPVEAVWCCCLGLGGMAVEEVLTHTLQEGKWYLPAEGLICHHQEREALLAHKVECVLVTSDGQLVLACSTVALPVFSNCTSRTAGWSGLPVAASTHLHAWVQPGWGLGLPGCRRCRHSRATLLKLP